MLIDWQSVIIFIGGVSIIGYLILRKVAEMFNSVTMTKAYHLHNEKLPSVKQVDKALESFRKSYQKKLRSHGMNVKKDDEVDENDPSYGNMFQ